MALRVERRYRTVSYEAACVIAGSLPWELPAGVYNDMYNWKAARRNRALQESQADPLEIQGRKEARHGVLHRQRKFEEWKEAVAQPRKGFRAVGAIHPVLKKWVDRRHGALGFRLVQVLTETAMPGEYLHRIGKKPTTLCHHCGAPSDTAEHTLMQCPAWKENRRVLWDATSEEIFLPTLVKAMVGRKDAWGVVTSFCEYVMSQKEVAERKKEADVSASPSRRRRGGAARRAHARLDLTPP
jgi:hypothetical protein